VRFPDGDVVLGIRPEHLAVSGGDGAGTALLELAVDVVEPLGNEVMVHGWVAAEPYVADQSALPDLGGEGRTGFTTRLDPGLRTAAGETIQLGFDPAAAHVFDAATGARLTPG
jgi:ABC-type sugar transport system ATPase subunit